MTARTPHPLAIPGNQSGAVGLNAGDRFAHDHSGRRGWADEFLQDGGALVTYDGGEHATVRWNHLSPKPSSRAA